MPQYKLYYFAVRGLAEPIRMAFAWGGIPLEDCRYRDRTIVEARDKGELHPPFGKFPFLEIDGVAVAQTPSILRYVAKLPGVDLYPTDPMQAAVAESVLDQLLDIGVECGKVWACKDNEEKAKFWQGMEEKFPALVKGVRNYIGDKPFVFGVPTFVDFRIHGMVYSATKNGWPLLKHIPEFQRIHDNLQNHPRLKEYFAKRAEIEAKEGGVH